MEVSIVSRKDNEVELKINDEDISIMYILQHELLNNEDVKFAGFALQHPLKLEYIFRLVTNKKDPLSVLIEALNKSINNAKKLNDVIKG